MRGVWLPSSRVVRSDAASPDAPALARERVTVRYAGAERPALVDVSLTVRRGARVTVVGASGSGRSMLLTAAVGLLRREADVVGARQPVMKVMNQWWIRPVRRGLDNEPVRTSVW